MLFVRTFQLDRKLPSTWTEKNFHNDIKFPGNISIGQSHDEKQFNFRFGSVRPISVLLEKQRESRQQRIFNRTEFSRHAK